MDFKLTEEQQKAVNESIDLRNGKHVLLLGKAGVGKSVTVHEIKEALLLKGLNGIVCAPTGIAAINVGGQTIHKTIIYLRKHRPHVDYIIMDEASMCRADLFDQLAHELERCGFSDHIFGGTKLILVGDPSQLPPVVKEDAEKEYIEDNYHSPYFFSSACFAKADWSIIELTKIFRQTDVEFPRLLNSIRDGEDVRGTVDYINDQCSTDSPEGVVLTATNKQADAINKACLQHIEEPEYSFDAITSGQIYPQEYPAPSKLDVKVGAQVMIIKNIYERTSESYQTLINGDVGEITGIYDTDPDNPSIEIFCERTDAYHTIYRDFWEKEEKKYDYKQKEMTSEVVASFTQFPMRLAYAITIHKSQGRTIEKFTIDMTRPMFAPGQLYVALSRGVTLDGVKIIGKIRRSDVILDDDVRGFLVNYEHAVGIKSGSKFDTKGRAEAIKESYAFNNPPSSM